MSRLSSQGNGRRRYQYVLAPLVPKIPRPFGYHFASRLVRPWCHPRSAKSLTKRICYVALFSEYLLDLLISSLYLPWDW